MHIRIPFQQERRDAAISHAYAPATDPRTDQEILDEYFACNAYVGERPDWRDVDPETLDERDPIDDADGSVTCLAREPTKDEKAGMRWWNSLSEVERIHALTAAGWRHGDTDAPSVADAWAAYKRRAKF